MGSNVYRVDNNGKFKGIPEQNFTDEVDEETIAKYERKGKNIMSATFILINNELKQINKHFH